MFQSKVQASGHFLNELKCFLNDDCSYDQRKRSIPTLYRLWVWLDSICYWFQLNNNNCFAFICRCIRIIARNIERCNCDGWDLSQLPSTIKTDLIRLNMKLSIGFTNEQTFIQLLTPSVTQLMFRACIVTDSMLECIGERCKNLQELRIFDDKLKKLHISSVGLVKCITGLQHITALQIVESDKVNDDVVEIISRNCTHLQSLCLNDCKNVTDESSESLKSMKLNDLNLANTSVSDERFVFIVLIHFNLNLNRFTFVDHFIQITNKWLSNVACSELMESLRDICLKNCKVSNEGLQNLNWKRLENINIIGVSIRGELQWQNHSFPLFSIIQLRKKKNIFHTKILYLKQFSKFKNIQSFISIIRTMFITKLCHTNWKQMFLSIFQIYHSSHRQQITRPWIGRYEWMADNNQF